MSGQVPQKGLDRGMSPVTERQGGEGSTPMARVLQRAVGAFRELSGYTPVSVTGLEHEDHDGWRVSVDVVEVERIPPTTSLMASYEIDVTEEGELRAYRRVRRFIRAHADESV